MDFGLDIEEEEHNTRHDLIEAMLWEVAERVLILGVDVILDFGFWGRSEREDYRSRAARLGASSQVHFLNVPEKELLVRLQARNTQLPPGTFLIPEDKLRAWILQFQSPAQDELERREALSNPWT
jgi:predicted kinase